MPAINDIIVRTRTEVRDIEINLINDFIFLLLMYKWNPTGK